MSQSTKRICQRAVIVNEMKVLVCEAKTGYVFCSCETLQNFTIYHGDTSNCIGFFLNF